MNYIQNQEKKLSKEDAMLLKEIYAPTEVGIPPENAVRGLMAMPDGSLRHYGYDQKESHSSKGRAIYIESKDCGLSWKKRLVPEEFPTHVKYLEEYGLFMGVEAMESECSAGMGAYAVICRGGELSKNVSRYKITDLNISNVRVILPLQSRKRIVVAAEYVVKTEEKKFMSPFTAYSDDGGVTWSSQLLEMPPEFKIRPPHKGTRWQNQGCEPTIAELDDGTLLMLVRTSQDYFYQYYSHDGGETWTKPEPSPFHATLTMPYLLKLTDGRLLFFWCNTQPLPEVDHTKQRPVMEDCVKGIWEDVFTNRDANHAAISEDQGKTWKGFRELALNPIRNHADFRSIGGITDSNDKSMHQFEALELPYNKILLSYGQHPTCRRLLIFDINWLLETERTEDFREGLGNVSTQTYLLSNSGGYSGFSGHCAWNRTDGAVLTPDPDNELEEAVFLSRIRDPRLFSEVQGLVWNFPASSQGCVMVKMKVLGCGLRISLTDRWFNPIDRQIGEDAQISFVVDKSLLGGIPNWHTIQICFDGGHYTVSLGDKELLKGEMKNKAPNGLCYLHLQETAEETDSDGIYIKLLKKSNIR